MKNIKNFHLLCVLLILIMGINCKETDELEWPCSNVHEIVATGYEETKNAIIGSWRLEFYDGGWGKGGDAGKRIYVRTPRIEFYSNGKGILFEGDVKKEFDWDISLAYKNDDPNAIGAKFEFKTTPSIGELTGLIALCDDWLICVNTDIKENFFKRSSLSEEVK